MKSNMVRVQLRAAEGPLDLSSRFGSVAIVILGGLGQVMELLWASISSSIK